MFLLWFQPSYLHAAAVLSREAGNSDQARILATQCAELCAKASEEDTEAKATIEKLAKDFADISV